MSANSSLAIRIAAIFDNKGLKQADKGIKGLQANSLDHEYRHLDVHRIVTESVFP